MIKLSTYTLLFALLLLACNCKPEVQVDVTSEIIVEDQDAIISSIGEQLSPKVKQKLTHWNDFQEVRTTMDRYTAITVRQALDNAKELSTLVKKVSDTIRIEMLDRSDMRIRFNVLYNHSLRLDDMATIPSITDAEVKDEVARLLSAFSAVNDKINAIYKIEAADKEFAVQKIEKKPEVEKSKPAEVKKVKPKKVGIGTAK